MVLISTSLKPKVPRYPDKTTLGMNKQNLQNAYSDFGTINNLGTNLNEEALHTVILCRF